MTPGALALLAVHAGLLIGIAYYYHRRYRLAVRANNRRVESLVLQHRVDELEAELAYLRKRNEILMRGLFPRGDVFPGGFIDDDPELRALADLLDLMNGPNRRSSPAQAGTGQSGG